MNEYNIETRVTHFPLHPEIPEEGISLEALFAGRNYDIEGTNERLEQLMKQEELPYNRSTYTYNTRLAQELAAWSDRIAGEGFIHDALFRAYFVRNLNLGKINRLVQIAREVGLPEDEARIVLETRRYKDLVDADWERSRRMDIRGVPTFVANGKKAVGAQPYEVLVHLIQDAGAAQKKA